MALDLRETDAGVVLKVKASPGASRDRVVGLLGDALKVAVTVAPEKGRANRAILEVLAAALQLTRNHLEVVAGHASREKRILVHDMDRATLIGKLAGYLR